MKREDLIQLSADTFFDNDEGLINPGDHRAFNEAMIDYIDASRPATFVVDSDETLNAWANATPGNDYTHVLIKPGTYTANATIDLEESVTLTVIGMAGSKIVSTRSKGITGYYNNTDYILFGVTLEMNGGWYAFDSCANLMNCTAIFNAITPGYHAAFCRCKYLTNCTGVTKAGSGATAFHSCDYLTNCRGSSHSDKGLVHGFYVCRYLTNCFADAESAGHAYGFNECEYLNNCVGEARALALSGNGLGFKLCNQLFGCSGKGISESIGYGFSDCRCLFGCRESGTSTNGTYNRCFMTPSGSTAPVGATAEGGYNW